MHAALQAARRRLPVVNDISASAATRGAERVPFTSPARVAPAVREAILEALYTDRRALTRKRREGPLADADDAALGELEQYIAQWQAVEEEQATAAALKKLEALAERVAAIGTAVELKTVR